LEEAAQSNMTVARIDPLVAFTGDEWIIAARGERESTRGEVHQSHCPAIGAEEKQETTSLSFSSPSRDYASVTKLHRNRMVVLASRGEGLSHVSVRTKEEVNEEGDHLDGSETGQAPQ
jgi:hypothetical protein